MAQAQETGLVQRIFVDVKNAIVHLQMKEDPTVRVFKVDISDHVPKSNSALLLTAPGDHVNFKYWPTRHNFVTAGDISQWTNISIGLCSEDTSDRL